MPLGAKLDTRIAFRPLHSLILPHLYQSYKPHYQLRLFPSSNSHIHYQRKMIVPLICVLAGIGSLRLVCNGVLDSPNPTTIHRHYKETSSSVTRKNVEISRNINIAGFVVYNF